MNDEIKTYVSFGVCLIFSFRFCLGVCWLMDERKQVQVQQAEGRTESGSDVDNSGVVF